MKGVYSGQIDQLAGAVLQAADFLLYGYTRPVSDIFVRGGQRVKKRGFTGIRVAYKSD
ncbi:hypothetical protein D3C86_2047660 [compost metagenome]